MIATLIVKLVYEPGFEDAVAEALKEVPGSESSCLFDDTRNMSVTTIQQLDAERMIENAVQSQFPIRHNPSHIGSHFRIYSNRRTYYWSFRDEESYPFVGNRFSLAESGKSLCASFNKTPEDFRFAFTNEPALRLPKRISAAFQNEKVVCQRPPLAVRRQSPGSRYDFSY